MNHLERPVFIRKTAPRKGVEHNAVGFFEVTIDEGRNVSKVDIPLWVNNVDFVKNGMSWFTHRRVFRQLAALGMTPKTLHVKIPGGVRIFSHSTHHSFLKVE